MCGPWPRRRYPHLRHLHQRGQQGSRLRRRLQAHLSAHRRPGLLRPNLAEAGGSLRIHPRGARQLLHRHLLPGPNPNEASARFPSRFPPTWARSTASAPAPATGRAEGFRKHEGSAIMRLMSSGNKRAWRSWLAVLLLCATIGFQAALFVPAGITMMAGRTAVAFAIWRVSPPWRRSPACGWPRPAP